MGVAVKPLKSAQKYGFSGNYFSGGSKELTAKAVAAFQNIQA